MVEDAEFRKIDLCTTEGFQETVDRFVRLDCLELVDENLDEKCDETLYDSDGMCKPLAGPKSVLRLESPLAHLGRLRNSTPPLLFGDAVDADDTCQESHIF